MKKSVLIVEDSKNISLMIEKCLKGKDFEVTKASDGVEAMVKVFELKPDIMLLDLVLPKLSGISVCEAVKSNELLCETTIIAMSARTEENQINSILRAGADGYILKPFTPKELTDKMSEYLRLEE